METLDLNQYLWKWQMNSPRRTPNLTQHSNMCVCVHTVCVSIVIPVIDYLGSLAGGQIYLLAPHPPSPSLPLSLDPSLPSCLCA